MCEVIKSPSLVIGLLILEAIWLDCPYWVDFGSGQIQDFRKVGGLGSRHVEEVIATYSPETPKVRALQFLDG